MSHRNAALESIEIIDPLYYEKNGYPYEAWALLRREAPILRWDRLPGQPFWAVTRHADIVEISRRTDVFKNEPLMALVPGVKPPPDQLIFRHLLTMDPPDHRKYRALLAARFKRRAVRGMGLDMEGIIEDLLEELGPAGECDFVDKVAAPLQLIVIAEQLGIPQSDRKQLFDWTNAAVGSTDPEFQLAGESAEETLQRTLGALFAYFGEIAEDRRARPRDDLASVLANATVDGGPLGQLELLSYFFLLLVAGNETTRNAMTGGLHALIENPGEFRRLKANPTGLADRTVEEIVRWTTPVIQLCRTPVEDVEVAGVRVAAGEPLCLFYASANRDEQAFEAPDEFRIDRWPNPHLAYGIGEHFCLGANLARFELEALFLHLAARLESVELAGPVDRLRSSFVGGIKRMPIRYRMGRSR